MDLTQHKYNAKKKERKKKDYKENKGRENKENAKFTKGPDQKKSKA